MNTECELYAVELSALIDHGLEPSEVPPVIDHLVECPECRAFWMAARGLDGALVDLRGAGDVDLPPGMWQQIREAAGAGPADDVDGSATTVATLHRRRLPAWTLRLAAALAAAVALVALLGPRLAPERARSSAMEIQRIGGDAPMEQEQLLAVAAGLLRADPRDRAALVDILEAVDSRQRRREGSVDRVRPDEIMTDLALREDGDAGSPQYATY